MTNTASANIARRHDLDALRAFAMLSGILLHASLAFFPMLWPVQDSQQHHEFGLILTFLHGFRMPLFFLISGFFTAMLWRKRGLKSLLRNRFGRILLPLLLGWITIIPAMNWISEKAVESGVGQELTPITTQDVGAAKNQKPDEQTEQVSSTSPMQEIDFWTIASTGDINAMKQHLANGADVNQRESKSGQTLLTMIALFGQTEMIELLLDKGANVTVITGDNSTSLHNAVIFGHDKTVELLLKNGADINAKNAYGHKPLQVAGVDWDTTQFFANLVQIKLDKDKWQAGRTAIDGMLKEYGATSQEGLAKIIGELQVTPVFHHLWFLWFLCWLVVGFAIYAAIANWLNWKGPSDWLFLSPARYLWLIPITMIPQWFMYLPIFGPDTSTGLIPIPQVLLFYAIFFGFGALYYDANDETGRVGRWYWLTLPLAIFLIFPMGLYFLYDVSGTHDSFDQPTRLIIANILQVAYAWLMTFGCIGLFRKLMSRESKTMRYLSDASYWLYVTHLPLIIAAQMFVRNWQMPAIAKLILICVIVTGFLLLVYQTLVRYTWLGTFLNGPRKRSV
jgi:peptidoglycan/LPS O-acetylase OafA/YrhL